MGITETYFLSSVFAWAVLIAAVTTVLLTVLKDQPIAVFLVVVWFGAVVVLALIGVYWLGYQWLDYMNAWPIGELKL